MSVPSDRSDVDRLAAEPDDAVLAGRGDEDKFPISEGGAGYAAVAPLSPTMTPENEILTTPENIPITPLEIMPAPEKNVAVRKKAGRPPGARNRRTKEIETILRPQVPRAKKRLRQLLLSDNEDISMRAIQLLLGYIFGKPVDRQQLSGPDGLPIRTQAVSDLVGDDRELGRRICLALGKTGQIEDDPQEHLVDPGPQEPPEPPEQPIQGEPFTFGPFELVNNGPQRDGLPDSFAVFRAGELIRQGSFADCRALVSRHQGDTPDVSPALTNGEDNACS